MFMFMPRETKTESAADPKPNPKHRAGYDPKAKRPTAQPVTDRADITPGGFSEVVATYHERLATPLENWTPHRPERPEKSGRSKPLRVVSDYEPAGDQPTAIKELSEGIKTAPARPSRWPR
jgi:excinuclease ABC subunit B